MFGLKDKVWAVLGATGLVLGATYMLWLYQKTMFGKLENDENRQLTDLTVREFAYLVPLVVLSFWIGIRPEPFFRILDEPVTRLVKQIEKSYEFPRGDSGLMPRPAVAQAPQQAPGKGPDSR